MKRIWVLGIHCQAWKSISFRPKCPGFSIFGQNQASLILNIRALTFCSFVQLPRLCSSCFGTWWSWWHWTPFAYCEFCFTCGLSFLRVALSIVKFWLYLYIWYMIYGICYRYTLMAQRTHCHMLLWVPVPLLQCLFLSQNIAKGSL